jgi:hypothetical protein
MRWENIDLEEAVWVQPTNKSGGNMRCHSATPL